MSRPRSTFRRFWSAVWGFLMRRSPATSPSPIPSSRRDLSRPQALAAGDVDIAHCLGSTSALLAAAGGGSADRGDLQPGPRGLRPPGAGGRRGLGGGAQGTQGGGAQGHGAASASGECPPAGGTLPHRCDLRSHGHSRIHGGTGGGRGGRGAGGGAREYPRPWRRGPGCW